MFSKSISLRFRYSHPASHVIEAVRPFIFRVTWLTVPSLALVNTTSEYQCAPSWNVLILLCVAPFAVAYADAYASTAFSACL